MTKGKRVVCRQAWQFAQGEPLTVGTGYTVVRLFWRNGEGWLTVVDDAGKRTTAPDVFFDVLTQAVPLK